MKPNFSNRDELLYYCAELFYIKKLTKREIASIIHVSPTHVKRLLNEAVEKGIVSVEVKIAGRFRKLEQKLVQKYQLQFARVVEQSTVYDELKTNLGAVAAEILDEYVERRSRTRVGIGGGGSLLKMIDALEKKPRAIDIYPTSLFGRGAEVEFISSTFLSYYLLIKSMPIATAKIVGIPPLPKNKDKAKSFAKWLLREIDEVKQVYEESKLVDIVFMGLGAAIPSKDIFSEYEKLGYSFELMKSRGAIGGLNYNYFDEKGNQIGTGILTLSIEEIKLLAADSAKTVIIVAGGSHKKEALKVALSKQMANAVITDEANAKFLLK